MNSRPLIFVVDDDDDVRLTVRMLLDHAGYSVRCHASAKSCLNDELSVGHCVISDVRMPEMDGLEFLERVSSLEPGLPVVFITGHADVPLAVRAMKSGAIDFVEKPFESSILLGSIEKALVVGQQKRSLTAEAASTQKVFDLLTPREKQVLELIVSGHSHKTAARELGISHRTVEIHRAHVMAKLDARTLVDLVRLVHFQSKSGPVQSSHSESPGTIR